MQMLWHHSRGGTGTVVSLRTTAPRAQSGCHAWSVASSPAASFSMLSDVSHAGQHGEGQMSTSQERLSQGTPEVIGGSGNRHPKPRRVWMEIPEGPGADRVCGSLCVERVLGETWRFQRQV